MPDVMDPKPLELRFLACGVKCPLDLKYPYALDPAFLPASGRVKLVKEDKILVLAVCIHILERLKAQLVEGYDSRPSALRPLAWEFYRPIHEIYFIP